MCQKCQMNNIKFCVMKKMFVFEVVLFIIMNCNSVLQAQVRDSTRVYDVVTDADTVYLFPAFKPCFMPWRYDWSPAFTMLQEYVATDTVTVYGVAMTVENSYDFLDTSNTDYNTIFRALLMKPLGPSPTNNYAVSMDLVDSVAFVRSHPRFCWFRYEDECDEHKPMDAPCYEFYFDTPKQINKTMDTFYVGRYRETTAIPYYVPIEYGGQFSTSYPSTIYQSMGFTGESLDLFFPAGAITTGCGVSPSPS